MVCVESLEVGRDLKERRGWRTNAARVQSDLLRPRETPVDEAWWRAENKVRVMGHQHNTDIKHDICYGESEEPVAKES